MADNPNVAELRRRYAAWHDCKGTDADVWLDLLADDMHLWSICGGAPGAEFSAECSCREDAARYLSMLSEAWEMQYYETDEYISDGDRVVVLGRTAWRSKTTGKLADTRKADIWHFRDGRAVSFAEFYDSAAVFAAAR